MPINVRHTEDALQLIDAGLLIAQEHNVRMTAEQLLMEGFVATEAKKGLNYVKSFAPEVIRDLEQWIKDFLTNPVAPAGFRLGSTHYSVEKGNSGNQRFISAGKHWEYTIAMTKVSPRKSDDSDTLLIYIEEDNAYKPHSGLFANGREHFALVKFYEPAVLIKAMIGLYSSGQWNKDL